MTGQDARLPVTVGVDGSSSAMHAVRWAARQAARDGTGLRLVHAYEVPRVDQFGFAHSHSLDAALRRQGRQWLADARSAVVETAPGTSVELEVRRADPVTTLLEQADRSRLLVVGTRGLGVFNRLLVGSTAVALANHASCPVAVVRGRDPDSAPSLHGPVVVGLDGSSGSDRALEFAVDEAVARGAELVAVQAWPAVAPEYALYGGTAMAGDLDAVRVRGEEVLAERLAGWQAKYPTLPITRRAVLDRPSSALLEAARSASLVVVGARGRGGFLGLLLGSTSLKLLHHAPCPVVVARSRVED